MKKAIIAILVLFIVCSASAFADSGVDNYSGIGVGFGFTRGKIEDLINFKENQVVISFTDFGFIDKSPVGLFIDGALAIDSKYVEFTDHSEYVYPTDKLPLGMTVAIGPAFKLDLGKKLDLLLGVGFQMWYNREYYDYGSKDPYEAAVYWDEYYYGVGAVVEAAYEISKDFAVTVGASGSYFFANTRYYNDYFRRNVKVSYDEFWEYRVIPQVSVY